MWGRNTRKRWHVLAVTGQHQTLGDIRSLSVFSNYILWLVCSCVCSQPVWLRSILGILNILIVDDIFFFSIKKPGQPIILDMLLTRRDAAASTSRGSLGASVVTVRCCISHQSSAGAAESEPMTQRNWRKRRLVLCWGLIVERRMSHKL